MITPTTTLSVPTGVDQYAYSVSKSTTFRSTGVVSSASLSFQRYRANTDGTNPTPIGPPVSVPIADVAAASVSDPALATLAAGIETLIQAYVTAKGL